MNSIWLRDKILYGAFQIFGVARQGLNEGMYSVIWDTSVASRAAILADPQPGRWAGIEHQEKIIHVPEHHGRLEAPTTR